MKKAIIYVFSHNFLRFLSLLHTYQRWKGRAWSHRDKNKIGFLFQRINSSLRGSYKGLQGVTWGYRGLYGVLRRYKGLKVVARGCKGLQRIKEGKRGLQEVEGCYKGLQGIKRG